MKAKEFFKQSFPTIEFKDKWDTQIRQFSADDMVEFAERFAEQKKTNTMNNKKIFLKEAKEVRDELVEIARQYPINEHLELRTKIDTLLIIYDQACELVNTCDCKKELEKHRKEANGFIKSIAEMVGIETDVVGFDGIKLSIDDFEEAIRRLRDEPELNNTPLPSDYDAGILGNNGGGNIDWWQDYIREEIARCNGYWRDYFEGL